MAEPAILLAELVPLALGLFGQFFPALQLLLKRPGPGGLFVKLLPYSKAYYTSLSPGFEWPSGVREDDDGHPVVPVVGLLKTTEFALS